MSSVSARSPRLVGSAALALALIAATGVASPRSRVAGRDRAGRAVTARLGSTRIDDRLTWVAPDPSVARTTTLAADDEPLNGRTAPTAASIAPSVAPASGVTRGPGVREARVAGARAVASLLGRPSLGRAPPQA